MSLSSSSDAPSSRRRGAGLSASPNLNPREIRNSARTQAQAPGLRRKQGCIAHRASEWALLNLSWIEPAAAISALPSRCSDQYLGNHGCRSHGHGTVQGYSDQLAEAMFGDRHSNACSEEQQARGPFGAMRCCSTIEVIPIELMPRDESYGVEP